MPIQRSRLECCDGNIGTQFRPPSEKLRRQVNYGEGESIPLRRPRSTSCLSDDTQRGGGKCVFFFLISFLLKERCVFLKFIECGRVWLLAFKSSLALNRTLEWNLSLVSRPLLALPHPSTIATHCHSCGIVFIFSIIPATMAIEVATIIHVVSRRPYMLACHPPPSITTTTDIKWHCRLGTTTLSRYSSRMRRSRAGPRGSRTKESEERGGRIPSD